MNELAVTEDMKKSLNQVKDKIKPILAKLLPDWRLLRVEGKDEEVCKMLDMSCGIDYLLCSVNSCQIYGVASRVQYNRNYRTFTVRKDRESGAITEYEKRRQAMYFGTISPKYTMQAYIENEDVSGLGLTKTADLMNFIHEGHAQELKTKADKIGKAEFYVCSWDKMKKYGYKVIEYSIKGDMKKNEN